MSHDSMQLQQQQHSARFTLQNYGSTPTASALSPPARHDLNAFVPFSWEEKPGVPKSNILTNHQQQQLLSVSFHIPAADCSILPCPPRLQHPRALSKTSSFDLPSSRHSSNTSTDPAAPKLLHRKQSFDNVVLAGHGCRKTPLTRKYSHGSLMAQQTGRSCRSKLGTLIRKEDDPFLMAIQVCRKEPIRVFYHHERSCASRVDCRKVEKDPIRPVSCDLHLQGGGQQEFKHLTIRQLFTQQIQEEENLHKAQLKRPLIIVDKKHISNKGPFTFLTRCLGC